MKKEKRRDKNFDPKKEMCPRGRGRRFFFAVRQNSTCFSVSPLDKWVSLRENKRENKKEGSGFEIAFAEPAAAGRIDIEGSDIAATAAGGGYRI